MFKRIVCFILLSVMLFALASCDNTTPSEDSDTTLTSEDSDNTLTSDEFFLIMTNNGYEIATDIEDEPDCGTVFVIEADSAFHRETFFVFAVFESEEFALKYFDYKKSSFESLEKHSFLELAHNYFKGFVDDDPRFFAEVTCIGNTILICRYTEDAKTEAEQIIKELGYGK